MGNVIGRSGGRRRSRLWGGGLGWVGGELQGVLAG